MNAVFNWFQCNYMWLTTTKHRTHHHIHRTDQYGLARSHSLDSIHTCIRLMCSSDDCSFSSVDRWFIIGLGIRGFAFTAVRLYCCYSYFFLLPFCALRQWGIRTLRKTNVWLTTSRYLRVGPVVLCICFVNTCCVCLPLEIIITIKEITSNHRPHKKLPVKSFYLFQTYLN